jgi:YidC/Oxa1 family membrane protein insertase
MMEKRMLLAVVLCFLVLVIYYKVFTPSPVPSGTQVPVSEEAAKGALPPSPLPTKPVRDGAEPKEALGTPGIPVIESQDIIVETDLVKAVFTTQGARLKSYQLKKYKSNDGGDKDYELINPNERNEYPLSLEILADKELVRENWKPSKDRLLLDGSDPTGELKFNYLTSQGLKVIKVFKFYNGSYKIDARVTFQNTTSQDLQLPGYKFSWGPGIGEEEKKKSRRYGQFSGPASLVNGELKKDTLTRGILKPATVKAGVPTLNPGTVGWVASKCKYFMAALVPPAAAQATVIELDAHNKVTVGVKMASLSLKGKEAVTHEFIVYPGPKDYDLVKGMDLGLEQAVDLAWWSWLTPISLLLLKLFKWLYKLVPNYGVAIILITFLTKVVLLPFTHKSFTHMRAMQAIQPKINALREQHKGNPQELNKQMVELYRTHKLNPVGGCFPMLLQMPIFFALFGLLYTSIELRGAEFLWWIKDLSMPDTVWSGNFLLFGASRAISLNILPLLMGFTTYLQQKMTTVDPQQAKMMLFMPLIFTFIFYNFPSGLVLYWLVTNTLTIGQQYMIGKKMPVAAK